ncbi:chorismate mutase [Cysteiniphilum sp. 6C5]|uniref:chorismate mutase n=1 Tax=unclassified Cysteiniphilum TaxID=2610889 RepID=UPI003F82DC80
MAAVLTSVAHASDCDSSKLTNAFNLIAKRAEVMQLVAADKYSAKTNIYAPAREIKVLQNVQAIAKKEGLPLYPTLMFSQLQMDMSKFIEQYWLDKWISYPKSFDHKDLDLTKLRATISSVDKSLYPAIKEALPSLKRCSLAISSKAFKQAMNKVQGVPSSPDYVNMMLASLVAISQAQQ